MKFKVKKRWIWIVIALIVVALAVVGFTASKGKNKDQQIKTVKVEKKDIVDKALAVGAVEPDVEVAVKSKISGVVRKLYVDVGDYVKSGDLLLEVKPDPTPLELAEAKRGVEMRQIEVETLTKELERNKQMKSKGLISDQDYEVMLRQYDEAVLSVKIASERLALLESGKVMIAGSDIESVVRAPVDGYILEKVVEVGDPVVPLTSYQAGTELLKMADMKKLIFKGTVDEIDVGKIHEGLAADLQVGALPGKNIKGHVSLISLKARKQENTTVFPIEIIIDSTDGAVLRAGFSANAHIIIAKRDSVLSVPERVVTFRNDSAFVMLPVEKAEPKEHFIKTGLSDAVQIEVTEGLNEGQEVCEKKTKEII
jgi:HlyD family secretion protein